MTTVKVYNLEGKETEKIELDDSVFGLAQNDDLVHQAAVALMGNKRQVLAHTKTRGERAGSGRKPWRQKGTGRARVGSARTPVWRKGGVVFGPSCERNFKRKINKKMNSRAILTTLSGKLRDQELFVVEKLDLPEKKTKKMAEVLKSFKLKGRVLMVFSDTEKKLGSASRNLKPVENVLVGQLNVLNMLHNKNMILSKESVRYLEEKYKTK